MQKGKFGFKLWVYPVVAMAFFVLDQFFLGALAVGFAIAAEKNEWVSHQVRNLCRYCQHGCRWNRLALRIGFFGSHDRSGRGRCMRHSLCSYLRVPGGILCSGLHPCDQGQGCKASHCLHDCKPCFRYCCCKASASCAASGAVSGSPLSGSCAAAPAASESSVSPAVMLEDGPVPVFAPVIGRLKAICCKQRIPVLPGSFFITRKIAFKNRRNGKKLCGWRWLVPAAYENMIWPR